MTSYFDALEKTAKTAPIVIWKSTNPPSTTAKAVYKQFTPENITAYNKVASNLIATRKNIILWDSTENIARAFDKLWKNGKVENYVMRPTGCSFTTGSYGKTSFNYFEFYV